MVQVECQVVVYFSILSLESKFLTLVSPHLQIIREQTPDLRPAQASTLCQVVFCLIASMLLLMFFVLTYISSYLCPWISTALFIKIPFLRRLRRNSCPLYLPLGPNFITAFSALHSVCLFKAWLCRLATLCVAM